jgi:hypothetical protein
MEQLGSQWNDFGETFYMRFFENLSGKFQAAKSDKCNAYFS